MSLRSFVQATLEEAVRFVRPSVLIGVSAQGGSFTTPIIEEMARISERPVIFALSNPTDNVSCAAVRFRVWMGFSSWMHARMCVSESFHGLSISTALSPLLMS